MSKVFVNIGLSLDGYMAPEGMTMEHWDTPEYKNWGAKWGALMAWLIKLQYFRENHKFGPGGERPARSMTCFAAPRSASVPTLWASECSTKARPLGPRRLRFTRRYAFLPMRNANLGRAPVGPPFTSSMTGRGAPLSWLGNPQAVVISVSQVERM